MPFIGFHASHEQFSPKELLDLVQAAEDAGFQEVMSADHFNPWSERQGQSGYTWSWLGAALQATRLPFGSLAIPGGWRYHPAMLAQAIATLADMFPDRFRWIAAGSGQALNELVFNGHWPIKSERNRRLKAAVDIMRSLWAGETVTADEPFIVREAKLWSLPQTAPQVFGAALTPETAEWMGSWADGLITVNQPRAKLEKVLEAFRKGGGSKKPVYLQLHLSWARTEEEALDNAYDQWRTNALGWELSEVLRSPALYDAAARHVRPEDMRRCVLISADPVQHAAWIAGMAEMGFDGIFLHNVGRNQREFIATFGRAVLPEISRLQAA